MIAGIAFQWLLLVAEEIHAIIQPVMLRFVPPVHSSPFQTFSIGKKSFWYMGILPGFLVEGNAVSENVRQSFHVINSSSLFVLYHTDADTAYKPKKIEKG